jgi:dimethylamine monooxygenase subunit C
MSTSTIKSRPVYGSLAPDPTGRHHVIVSEGPGIGAVARLLVDNGFPDHPRQVLHTPGAASRETDFTALSTSGGAEILADSPALLRRLDTLLGGCRMGTRLYAAGSESFLGAVVKIAAAHGLLADEYRTEHVGSAARRVHCTHCRQVTEHVTTNLVICSGCGRTLLVRDHYSRRLAAFMGVQADAELPGETPAVQEVFP